MKIERKFESVIETKKRYVIRQFTSVNLTVCAECGEIMLTIEQSAKLLSINQRRIFKIIETGASHFTETEAGALMICVDSLVKLLDFDS